MIEPDVIMIKIYQNITQKTMEHHIFLAMKQLIIATSVLIIKVIAVNVKLIMDIILLEIIELFVEMMQIYQNIILKIMEFLIILVMRQFQIVRLAYKKINVLNVLLIISLLEMIEKFVIIK